MPTAQTLSFSTVRNGLGVVAVLLLFGLPLFFGLARWDLHNDEAIYSYAVDRMLETNEWLTPRSIQVDGPFLEKPPLKFWIVAGLMRLDVLPHDDRGQRFVDALFGALAFGYVYLIGRRLSGVVCGVAAVLVLFAMDRLLFDHGLRSNNMEAALLLAYCGGLYHFARWSELRGAAGSKRHALAVAGYFVLAFMTKFVAAFFLPLICGVAFVWAPDPWPRVRRAWRSWLVPAAVAIVLIAPWFVYQTWLVGSDVWQVILGEHVYTRFTASLDPHHLHPWHYYFVETWKELSQDGSQWIVAAGVVVLAVKAWGGRPWLARLILVWWVVPFALLSFGTSKLFHYAYPFLPAIAIGAGYAAAVLVQVLDDGLRRALGGGILVSRLMPIQRSIAAAPVARRFLAAAAIVAAGIAIWTFAAGNVVVMVGDERWFKSSSLVRPIVIAAVLLWLIASVKWSARAFAVLPLVALLPAYDYPGTIAHMSTDRHPLRTLRDCALTVQRAHPDAAEGVYNAARPIVYRSYYYYLRGLGEWVEADHPDPADFERRLRCPGEQTPILVSMRDYEPAFRLGRPAGASCAAQDPPSPIDPSGASSVVTRLTIAPEEGVVILLPGPYASCGESVVEAGGFVVDVTDESVQ